MKKYFFIVLIILLAVSLSARSKWLGQDKILHFTGSAFLTYWNYGMNKDILGQTNEKSVCCAVSFTLALGIVKEYSDKKLINTGFSWYDLAYNTAGVLAGLAIINNLR